MKHIATQDLLPMNNSKLFIVEGPDSMGKTALAKFFAQRLKAVYLHCTAKDIQHDQYGYLLNMAKNAIENMRLHDCHVILDRHWPSEMCYAPVFRPDNVANTAEVFELTKEAIYIFCLPANGSSMLRHLEKPEHKFSAIEYNQIVENYVKLSTKLFLDKLQVFNYTIEDHGSDMESFLNMIM